jgi:hypothetical protein
VNAPATFARRVAGVNVVCVGVSRQRFSRVITGIFHNRPKARASDSA